MRITIKAGNIQVTDEYGKSMYESGFHTGMELFVGQAKLVQVTDYGQLQYEVGFGAGLHPPVGSKPSPIPPLGNVPPPETSPPVSGGSPVAPVNGGEIPWPASGQVEYHIPMQANQTVSFTLKWLSAMDPNKSGWVKVVEEPGSAVMPRHLKLSVNGVLKYDSTPYNETGPTGNLVNFPAPGGGSSVQMNSGDVLGIEVTNGDNNSAQPSNMLLDIAVPDRY
jgi:hypothetical protein